MDKVSSKILLIIFLLMFEGSCMASTGSESEVKDTKIDNSAATIVEDVTINQFLQLIADDSRTVILDVRTAAEFAAGHATDAVNIDVLKPDFNSRIENLDREKTYLLYCKSGIRSARAAQFMQAAGFSRLYNLAGGYDAHSELLP